MQLSQQQVNCATLDTGIGAALPSQWCIGGLVSTVSAKPVLLHCSLKGQKFAHVCLWSMRCKLPSESVAYGTANAICSSDVFWVGLRVHQNTSEYIYGLSRVYLQQSLELKMSRTRHMLDNNSPF